MKGVAVAGGFRSSRCLSAGCRGDQRTAAPVSAVSGRFSHGPAVLRKALLLGWPRRPPLPRSTRSLFHAHRNLPVAAAPGHAACRRAFCFTPRAPAGAYGAVVFRSARGVPLAERIRVSRGVPLAVTTHVTTHLRAVRIGTPVNAAILRHDTPSAWCCRTASSSFLRSLRFLAAPR